MKTFFSEKHLRAFMRIIVNSGGEIIDVQFVSQFCTFVVFYQLPKSKSLDN